MQKTPAGELKPFFDKLTDFKLWLKNMDDPIARIAYEKLEEFFKTTEETQSKE